MEDSLRKSQQIRLLKTREEEGGGRKAGQQGHQEGRAEHGNHVLGTNADGAFPAEAFGGGRRRRG